MTFDRPFYIISVLVYNINGITTLEIVARENTFRMKYRLRVKVCGLKVREIKLKKSVIKPMTIKYGSNMDTIPIINGEKRKNGFDDEKKLKRTEQNESDMKGGCILAEGERDIYVGTNKTKSGEFSKTVAGETNAEGVLFLFLQ